MKTYRVELLAPEAEQMLNEMVNSNLIKAEEMPTPKEEFKQLLAKIRGVSDEPPSLEEITREVEIVRAKRYKRRGKKA